MNSEPRPWPFPSPRPEPPQPAKLSYPVGSLGEVIDPCCPPTLGQAYAAWQKAVTEAVARLDNREPL